MGFASKHEDETERRDGEEPRANTRRLRSIFYDLGVGGNFPERRLGLNLDAAACTELDQIFTRLERHRQERENASKPEIHVKSKWVKRWLDAHKKYASDIDALTAFLATRVRKMRFLPHKRIWERKISQLRKARLLK